jgi:hypothetical protein
MEEAPQLHKIEDDLTETWVEDFAADGVEEIEEYLEKHLAFLTYLDEVEPQPAPHLSVEIQLGSISLANAE